MRTPYTLLKLKRNVRNIWLNSVCSSPLIPYQVRRYLYKLCGHNVTRVFSNCFLGYGNGKLYVGKNSYCNSLCFFDLTNDITIKDNCCVAMQVSFINATHEIGKSEFRGSTGYSKPIVVEDGCWICSRVTILPGVTIGRGCVIAAGALVVSDCEPNGLYAGVPAKRIKDLDI